MSHGFTIQNRQYYKCQYSKNNITHRNRHENNQGKGKGVAICQAVNHQSFGHEKLIAAHTTRRRDDHAQTAKYKYRQTNHGQ